MNIKYNLSNPLKLYNVTENEHLFFECLFSKVKENKFQLTRMSDGTLSVNYGTYPIGKIKLQGKKHYMQILKGSYGVTEITGSLDDFIKHQDEWIKYLKKHILKEMK